MDLIERFFAGWRLGGCPSPKLCAACLCLLLAFLFLPMGTLPQFVATPCDLLIIIFLFALAQSFFIRGIRSFSDEIYQTMDRDELSAISRFIATYFAVGGTAAWYVLVRGMPGGVLGFDPFTGMPLWSIMGVWGWIGIVCFVILLALNSPFRKTTAARVSCDTPLPEVYDALRSMLCPALVTAGFVSWTPATALGLYGWRMYMVGFASFWLEVMLIQLILFPLIWKIYVKKTSQLAERYHHAIMAVLAAAGVCGFLIDLYC